MTTMTQRKWTMAPFTVLGVAAILAGGIIAARIAAHPIPVLVWMIAYLVLVVGVAQYALGLGQARLAARTPPWWVIALQWLAFNLGNAGVIAGTVLGLSRWVIAGAVLFVIALLGLVWGVSAARRHPLWLAAYYALIALLVASAVVGIILSLNGGGY